MSVPANDLPSNKQPQPQIKHERIDFTRNFMESTQELIRNHYSKRDPITREPLESVNDVIYRVAESVALAELKYVLSPQEIVWIDLETALNHPKVNEWTHKFAYAMGTQVFFANTPANINADQEISLKVLKYWAYGKLAGLEERFIWEHQEIYEELYRASPNNDENEKSLFALDAKRNMGRLAQELKGRGTLAACGVTCVDDTLDSLLSAAAFMTAAAKCSLGTGINMSSIRPWNSMVATNGAAASGPDRFYHKLISQSVASVAQGGRRGGALIDLRNSDHPDVLIFIAKKALPPKPILSQIYKKLMQDVGIQHNKNEIMRLAEHEFGVQYAAYIEKQAYLKNTNISVTTKPGFMQAVKDKKWYQCMFAGEPWTGKIYDPLKPTGKVDKLTKELELEEYSVDLSKYPEAVVSRLQGMLYAPEVLDRIVEGMRTTGEPGLCFLDLVNESNANNHIYELFVTNPCNEQALPAVSQSSFGELKGICNLSSMHAAHPDFFRTEYVESGSTGFKDEVFDFEELEKQIYVQVRAMDNVSDVSWFPFPNQNKTVRLERRFGGGFAGVAEYLSKLGLEFGSEAANKAVTKLFRAYNDSAVKASQQLAEERGVYPIWYNSQFQKLGMKMRNACLTNNAPTGTLAQCMQTTWGVDPHNGIVFSRKVRTANVDFVAPAFEEAMKKAGAWPDTDEGVAALKLKIRNNNKSCRGLDEVPAEVQHAFPIRMEISPENYIRHLGAVYAGAEGCKYAFNAVSNTCSIPVNTPAEMIKDAIMLAYELKVKGLTFYPDGTRISQPFEEISSQQSAGESIFDVIEERATRKVNTEITSGFSEKIKCCDENGDVATLHVTVNSEVEFPGKAVEVYATLGKSGGTLAGMLEALGRVISAFLQYAAAHGEDERKKVEDIIVKQCKNVRNGGVSFNIFAGETKATPIYSAADALAKALMRFSNKALPAPLKSEIIELECDLVATNFREQVKFAPANQDIKKCSCGGMMTRADGCWICIDGCGNSKCG